MAAASTRSQPARLQLGVIAEDETDGQTLRVLLQRLRGGGTKVLTRSDQGCGAIGRKGERWVNDLVRAGCSAVIIVHDLDRHALAELRQRLEKIQPPAGAVCYVCIPVEELEAWFWADANVQTADRARQAHAARQRGRNVMVVARGWRAARCGPWPRRWPRAGWAWWAPCWPPPPASWPLR